LFDRFGQLCCARFDLLLETVGRLCLLNQQLVTFEGVLAQELNDSPHFCDLVAAAGRQACSKIALSNRQHAASKRTQPRNDAAPPIEPDNQDGAEQTKCNSRYQDGGAELLN